MKTLGLIVATICVLLSSAYAYAQTIEDLPKGAQFIIHAEQQLISRDLDTKRIVSPHTNNQDPAYKAEAGTIFEVESYWLNAEETHGFFADQVSKEEKQLWQRIYNGKVQYRFLVHPESKSLYEELFKNGLHAEKAESFYATATSSSRTLLMWPENQPEKVFFGKLSLNKEIAGFMRTIPVSETARSVGVSNILDAEKANLPKNFKYFPEVYGVIPQGLDRGGMLIRKIPEEVLSGKELVLPAFSLYAAPKEGRPLLAEMIAKSGLTAEEFIRNKIIRPFVEQWLTLENSFGISMEPHAQNLMMGVTADGKLNGNFIHRDFGGFNLDLDYRKRLKRPLPNLPQVRGVERDYHQVSEDKSYRQSLPKGIIKFFSAGFLFNLDQKVPAWKKQGWIPNSSPHGFELMLSEEMAEAFKNFSKGKINASDKTQAEWRRQDLYEHALRLREIVHPEASLSRQCSQVFN